jgi:hypothetical protein
MARQNKDSKFIIYQVLYIFVVTVLALKGAGLDLGEVVKKEDTVQKEVRDSLLAVIDSLNAKGLSFSINIDTTVVEQNIELKKQIASLSTNLKDLTKKIKTTPKPKDSPIKKVEAKLPSPFSKTKTFLQYAWNEAENKGEVPVKIYDPSNLDEPIVIVPPDEKKRFDLTDQEEVIVNFGSQEERVRVVKNEPPKINIESVTTKMSKAEIYAKELHRITVFRVTISDERIDQIKVNYTGPIKVTGPVQDKEGNLVYNVSLNIALNETKFDEWADRNENLQEADGRYKANFFFDAYDVKSKHKVNVGDSFYFTDYDK